MRAALRVVATDPEGEDALAGLHLLHELPPRAPRAAPAGRRGRAALAPRPAPRGAPGLDAHRIVVEEETPSVRDLETLRGELLTLFRDEDIDRYNPEDHLALLARSMLAWPTRTPVVLGTLEIARRAGRHADRGGGGPAAHRDAPRPPRPLSGREGRAGPRPAQPAGPGSAGPRLARRGRLRHRGHDAARRRRGRAGADAGRDARPDRASCGSRDLVRPRRLPGSDARAGHRPAGPPARPRRHPEPAAGAGRGKGPGPPAADLRSLVRARLRRGPGSDAAGSWIPTGTSSATSSRCCAPWATARHCRRSGA